MTTPPRQISPLGRGGLATKKQLADLLLLGQDTMVGVGVGHQCDLVSEERELPTEAPAKTQKGEATTSAAKQRVDFLFSHQFGAQKPQFRDVKLQLSCAQPED